MYLLKMVTIRFNYRPKRRIEVKGEHIAEIVAAPYSISRRCVEKDKDKMVQSMVSEYGIPDNIEFSDDYEPIAVFRGD